MGPADATGDVPGEGFGRDTMTRSAAGVGTGPATPTDPLQAATRPAIAVISVARCTSRAWPRRAGERLLIVVGSVWAPDLAHDRARRSPSDRRQVTIRSRAAAARRAGRRPGWRP